MEVVSTNAEVRREVSRLRSRGESLGFVPTMGYLHEGHLALIREARRAESRVAVSIFVNPTQFGPQEDFAAYPRDMDRDLALCREAGVDWVYTPEVSELYPYGPGTLVVPPESLTSSLCGEFRPGHFTGVATVVAKLFSLWQPDRAYFGLKDFQQTVVIRRMIADLCMPVEFVGVPTVRDPDGLAKSSRNVYLKENDRAVALAIPRALQAAWDAARQAASTPDSVLAAARAVLASEPGLSLQYVELVEPLTLAPATDLAQPAVLAVAAKVGATRLIDNLPLDGPAPLASPPQ